MYPRVFQKSNVFSGISRSGSVGGLLRFRRGQTPRFPANSTAAPSLASGLQDVLHPYDERRNSRYELVGGQALDLERAEMVAGILSLEGG